MRVQIPQESGFGNFNDNIGEIKFWGHEVALTSRNTIGKFQWTTNANISFNRNKVVALADGIDRVYGLHHITQVGKPLAQFYGHLADGVYLNAEDLKNSPIVPGRSTVGSIKLVDINGDGVLTNGGNNDDRTILGNPFPKFIYGITNNFRYGNFDLSIVGSGSYGNQIWVRHLYSTTNLDGVFNLMKEVKVPLPLRGKSRKRILRNYRGWWYRNGYRARLAEQPFCGGCVFLYHQEHHAGLYHRY